MINFLLVINLNCKWPWKFKRNPNLVQITSPDPDIPSSFCPKWHNSNRIYYLKSNHPAYGPQNGSVWCVEPNGANNREICSGSFDDLAISPDGRYLAVLPHNNKDLKLLDTNGNMVRNLSTKAIPFFIQFSKTEPKIYYLGKEREAISYGLYSINIEGENDTLLLRMGGLSGLDPLEKGIFDVSFDGLNFFFRETLYSLITKAKRYFKNVKGPLQFSKLNKDLLLYSRKGDIYIINLSNGKEQCLKAKPWEECHTNSLCWSPDEKSVVFSSVTTEGEFASYYIWVLKNYD